jgi:hypothetical protein
VREHVLLQPLIAPVLYIGTSVYAQASQTSDEPL